MADEFKVGDLAMIVRAAGFSINPNSFGVVGEIVLAPRPACASHPLSILQWGADTIITELDDGGGVGEIPVACLMKITPDGDLSGVRSEVGQEMTA